MAPPITFQPISLQQTLRDQKQLEALCAPRIMPPWEKYHANDNYGFATILKAYSSQPFDKSLPVLLTHGVYFDDQRLYDMERQCGLSGVMSYPDFRTKLWREQTDLRVIPSASPLLYAQRLMDQHFGPATPEVRSGTIYFLPHSTGHIKRDLDLDQVITKLKGYCQQQQQAGNSHLLPLSVCIHWQDITHGKHRPFKKAGLPVISAGHLSDPDFLFRLLHLLRLCNLALGAFPGGHVFASLVAGVPYIAWEPAKAVAEVSANFKNTLGSQRSPELSARIKHWESLFQPEQDPAAAPTPNAPITAAQQAFADTMLGREDLIGPDEMFALLRSFGYPFMSEESRHATDAHFRQRYAENPEAKDCFARLAEAYAHQKDLSSASHLIDHDRRLGRLTSKAELREALWLLQAGRTTQAETRVNRLYAQHPELNDGFVAFGLDCLKKNALQRAKDWFHKDAAANRISPRCLLEYADLLVATNDIENASIWLDRLVAKRQCSPDELPRLWWKLMEKGDLERALALAERDLRAGRLSASWKLKVAELYERCEETEQAVALVEALYAENKNLQDGFARIGLAKASRLADFTVAQEWCLRDQHHHRLSSQWKLNFARVMAIADQWDEAFALVEETYSESTTVKDGYVYLGYCGYWRNRGVDFYREQYQRDSNLGRQSAPHKALHGLLLEVAQGRFQPADAYRNDVQDFSWLVQIGLVCLKQSNFDLAQQLMDVAYAHQKMRVSHLPTYALLLTQLNLNDTANKIKEEIKRSASPSDMVFYGSINHPFRMTLSEFFRCIENKVNISRFFE